MKKLSNIATLKDLEIIQLYGQTKKKELIGFLFKRHTSFVFLVCMKYLKNEEKSKDAVMQIFEKLFSDLLKHNIDNFKAWLHIVSKNYCLGLLRKEQSNQKNLNRYKNDNSFMETELDEHHYIKVKEQNLNRLELAVKKLKPEQKTCIELFYLQEKAYDEIVQITGFTDKNVKSYIQNGKRNLKIIMEKFTDSAIAVFLFFLIY